MEIVICRQPCPYCDNLAAPTRTSMDGDATEFRCTACGSSHVLKKSVPGDAFAFFPADIAARASSDIKPLFPQTGEW